MNKKGLCMLLVAALVFAAALPLMPQTAAASGDVEIGGATVSWDELCTAGSAAYDAYLKDETSVDITLLGNVIGSLTVPDTVTTLTISGNGTITGDGTAPGAIFMEGASTLILNGKIKIEGEGFEVALAYFASGTLQLADGADVTLLGGTNADACPASAIGSQGDLTIHFGQGSKLVATNGEMKCAFEKYANGDLNIIGTEYSTAIIVGGNLTFTGTDRKSVV